MNTIQAKEILCLLFNTITFGITYQLLSFVTFAILCLFLLLLFNTTTFRITLPLLCHIRNPWPSSSSF